jgi:hypothetical protein
MIDETTPAVPEEGALEQSDAPSVEADTVAVEAPAAEGALWLFADAQDATTAEYAQAPASAQYLEYLNRLEAMAGLRPSALSPVAAQAWPFDELAVMRERTRRRITSND